MSNSERLPVELDIFSYAQLQEHRKPHAQKLVRWLNEARENLAYRELFIDSWLKRGYSYLKTIDGANPLNKDIFTSLRDSLQSIENRSGQTDPGVPFTRASESVRRYMKQNKLLFGLTQNDSIQSVESITLRIDPSDTAPQTPFYTGLLVNPHISNLDPTDTYTKFFFENAIWETYLIGQTYPESLPQWNRCSIQQAQVLSRYQFQYLPITPGIL